MNLTAGSTSSSHEKEERYRTSLAKRKERKICELDTVLWSAGDDASEHAGALSLWARCDRP